MTETHTRSSQSRDAALADLVDRLTARLKAGGATNAAALTREHPEYADELEQLLPAIQMLADLSRSGTEALVVADAQPLGELGDFRIIREVGRGGMGIVYEAEQNSLRRRVALKVLPFAATMDPRHLQRFQNEALAAASLHHEHIGPVHGVGCERGVHYYAMQFIDGHTLADMITADASRGRQPPENPTKSNSPGADAPGSPARDTAPIAALTTKLNGKDRAWYRRVAALIADAAEALEHAHSVGIVHRDVKPGNLMVDAAGKLWVTDFGLARSGPDAGLTMTGDLLGTLRYMAPEQALAKHGLVDHRVDVYGLGATLYELLTGKPAVGGTDKADVVRRLAFEEPVALRKLDNAIPAELETIALKCLAKNPSERYAAAGELAADLRRFVEDKPIKAKPPTARQRAVKWSRRHAEVVAAAAAGLSLVTVAAIASMTVVSHQKRQTDVALGQVREAYGTAREALDELSSRVIDDWLAQQPVLTVEHRAFLQRAVAKYEQFAALAGDDEPTRAAVAGAYFRVGDIRERLGQTADAETAYTQATELYQRLTDEFPDTAIYRVALAKGHRDRGGALERLGRIADADNAYKLAMARQEQLIRDAPGMAEYQYELAGTLLEFGESCAECNSLKRVARPAEAEKAYRRGLELMAGPASAGVAPPTYRHLQARLNVRLGSLLFSTYRRYADGERHHRRGIELLNGLVNAAGASPSGMRYREDLADGLTALAYDLGKNCVPWPKEALAAESTALATLERLAATFPAVPGYRLRLAKSLILLGNHLGDDQFQEAEKSYQRAVTTLEGLIQASPCEPVYRETLVESVGHLGDRYHKMGRFADAADAYRKALPMLEHLADDLPTILAYRLHLQSFLEITSAELVDAGRIAAAEDVLSRALVVRARLAADFPGSANDHRQPPATLQSDLPIFHYDAARAALAGWGKSLADLNDVERSHHRRQALGWLSADLATWAKLIDIQAERPKARQTMQHWLVDPDLAGVRGDAIAKLPEAERADWQKLWAEVAARLTALGDVGPKQPPAAKP